MTDQRRFFVLRLDERHFRPDPRATYNIQLLDMIGRASQECFVDEHGGIVSECSFAVPRAVIEAAFRQAYGKGDYVDANGRSIRPF